MKAQLQATVTLLSLINPVICGMMFSALEAERSGTEQLTDATKTTRGLFAIP